MNLHNFFFFFSPGEEKTDLFYNVIKQRKKAELQILYGLQVTTLSFLIPNSCTDNKY